jgi:hypothetical protein
MNPKAILDHPVISERYFFPRRDRLKDPFLVPVPGGALACHYERNHPDAPTLIHFHGNGEVVSDWTGDAFVSILDGMGYNVLLAEYRGYGMSAGSPSFGAILEDTPRILEAAGTEPSRTVLFGRSVGSIPAIRGVSLCPGIGGLVLESGIADLMERLLVRLTPSELGVGEADLEKSVLSVMDHRASMRAYTGPVLVMHTLHDHLVDISHGQRLYDWAGGSRKKLVVFDRGDHNSILFANARQYFTELGSFLQTIRASSEAEGPSPSERHAASDRS